MDTLQARQRIAGAIAELLSRPGLQRLVELANCHQPPSQTIRLTGHLDPDARRRDFNVRF